MDLISRQAAIDAADRADYPGLAVEVVKTVTDEVVKELKQLPSEQPNQRWIPCSERMPKVDEEVLATTVWDDVTIACRIGVDEWFIHEGGTNATTEDLIAWMPLPNPYKENT